MDELRRWSAELMSPGIAGLFLHGVAGIGKSALAAHIADQIRSEHPGTQVATITGALTVDQLVTTLVADTSSLVILDEFDANVADGTIADRGLAAVLVFLADEIATRDDQRPRARVILAARQPFVLSPHILVRHIGPLTRRAADEFASSLPRLGKLASAEREYAWRLTAGNPGSLRAFDERLADATFAEIADDLAEVITARTRMTATLILPTELDRSTAAIIASVVDPVLRQRKAPVRLSAAPDLATGPEARKRRRVPWIFVLLAALVGQIALPFAVKSLIAGSAPAAVTAHTANRVKPAALMAGPTRKAGATAEAGATSEADPTPEAEAAAWLADNVTGGTLIGCDPAMCANLSHQGLPRADLSPLRPGSDLTADSLIVATPQDGAQLASAIETAAPELAASFGTGSGRVGVWEVTPGGAAAYGGLLAADMASRRQGGNQLLGNTNVKATGNSWIVMCDGQVDGRILISLAAIAHSMPLTIVSIGAADPGAAAPVPVRSVLINVADPAAAVAVLKAQDPAMQPLAVRIGHGSVWFKFGAPSPLGLFQPES
jgi:hypothetical protein